MFVVDPKLELRRTAGKLAFALAGTYMFIFLATVYTLFDGHPLQVWRYTGLFAPIVLFVPAVIAGVRLHQTTDKDQTRSLWHKSLIYAVLGMTLALFTAFHY
jgi:hypothetical protein